MLSQENVYYFQRKDTLLLQQKLKCDNLLFIMAPQVTWVPYVPGTSIKFLKHGSKLWKPSHIPKESKSLGLVFVFLLLGLLNKFNMTYPFIKVQLDLLSYKDQVRRKSYIPLGNVAEFFWCRVTLKSCSLWKYLNAMYFASKI